MEIKLKHNHEKMNLVFGISDERAKVLERNKDLIDETFEFSKKSERLEKYYTTADNINEALYITFLFSFKTLNQSMERSNAIAISNPEELKNLLDFLRDKLL